jgi:hypothetical protein
MIRTIALQQQFAHLLLEYLSILMLHKNMFKDYFSDYGMIFKS